MSVLDQLKSLDEQRTKLLEGAKKEALEAAQKAIADLNALGFDFRLVEGPAQQEGHLGSVPRVKHQNVKRGIPLVQSASLGPNRTMTAEHIVRRRPKRAFTEEELKDKGLTKVA